MRNVSTGHPAEGGGGRDGSEESGEYCMAQDCPSSVVSTPVCE